VVVSSLVCALCAIYSNALFVCLYSVFVSVQNSKVLFMQSDGGLTPMSRLVL